MATKEGRGKGKWGRCLPSLRKLCLWMMMVMRDGGSLGRLDQTKKPGKGSSFFLSFFFFFLLLSLVLLGYTVHLHTASASASASAGGVVIKRAGSFFSPRNLLACLWI